MPAVRKANNTKVSSGDYSPWQKIKRIGWHVVVACPVVYFSAPYLSENEKSTTKFLRSLYSEVDFTDKYVHFCLTASLCLAAIALFLASFIFGTREDRGACLCLALFLGIFVVSFALPGGLL